MRIIEEIILKVGVDVTGLDDIRHAEDDLNGLESGVEDYRDSADKSTTATNSMGGAIGGMAIAAAAATAAATAAIATFIWRFLLNMSLTLYRFSDEARMTMNK